MPSLKQPLCENSEPFPEKFHIAHIGRNSQKSKNNLKIIPGHKKPGKSRAILK